MKQIDYGQVCASFAVRNRESFQDHPAGLILGLGFKDEARLARARFSYRSDDLAVARARKLGRHEHCFHLAFAPDELCKAAPGCALQAGAQGTEPGHLVNIDQLGDAFYFGRTQRLELEISLDQFARLLTDRDRAGWRDGLHPRRQVGGVPNRRVLDMAFSRLDRF